MKRKGAQSRPKRGRAQELNRRTVLRSCAKKRTRANILKDAALVRRFFAARKARQEDYIAFLAAAFLAHLAGALTTFASVTTGAGLCAQAVRVATAKAAARNRCFIGRKVFPLFAKESRSDSRRMRLIGYFFGFTQCSALPQTHLSEEKEDQELRKSGDFFSKSRLHLKICG